MTLRDVIDAHEAALVFGGLRGGTNGPALESAIGRPYNGYYPRIWSKAAALVQSLVGNHPFTDGNKRTALIVTNLFLLRSGYRLRPATTPDHLEQMILGVAAGELSFDDIQAWFRARVIRQG